MATRPTVGGSDGTWGTELNEHLDVSLDADGKVDDGAAQTTSAAATADAELVNKKLIDDLFAAKVTLSAYTNQDSESNAMLKDHAYKAATDGFVSVHTTQTNNAEPLSGFVGDTSDPAGAGDLIMTIDDNDVGRKKSIFFAVAAGEYFEITQATDTPVIRWKSMGTLSKPVDQD